MSDILGAAIKSVEGWTLLRCGHGNPIVDGAGEKLEASCGCRKCEFYVARQYGGPNGDLVRIEARFGGKILGRIEITLTDFAAAVMGSSALPAIFSTQRVEPKQRAALSQQQGGK